jgi:energy-coupling factor transport system permease protein
MLYRSRATPLHAAGPGAAVSWCAALSVAALVFNDAAELAGLILTVLVAGRAAGAGGVMGRALRWALGFAVVVCAINALVSQQGTTIIWHFGDVPVFGYRYVYLQAVGAGAVLGLRAVALILVGMLYSVAVNPDAVLVLARRISFRSALTATIATRMVPVLLRDSRRLAEAQRTRSGEPPSRLALLQATTSGVLDRALDVAATLEVRGFGLAGASASARRAHNRHDAAFALTAALVLADVACARLSTPWIAGGLPLVALAPFLGRRGIG